MYLANNDKLLSYCVINTKSFLAKPIEAGRPFNISLMYNRVPRNNKLLKLNWSCRLATMLKCANLSFLKVKLKKNHFLNLCSVLFFLHAFQFFPSNIESWSLGINCKTLSNDNFFHETARARTSVILQICLTVCIICHNYLRANSRLVFGSISIWWLLIQEWGRPFWHFAHMNLFFNYRELLSKYKRLASLNLSRTYKGEPLIRISGKAFAISTG